MSAGSDIHNPGQSDMGGMMFDHKINSIDEYIKAFMNNEGTPVFIRDIENNKEFKEVKNDKALTVPTQGPTLEVVWH
jgi:hypothetical protein